MSSDDYQLAPPYQPRRTPEYTEDGCARTTGQALRILATPFVFLVGFLASLLAGSYAFAGFLAFFTVVFGVLAAVLLSQTWPLGIRLDAQGIRIGAVAAQEKGGSRVKHRDKPISGTTRALHVYASRWPGVRRVRVLTDRGELAAMAANLRSGGAPGYAGAWWSGLGHAAWAPGRFISTRTGAVLVLEVRADLADYQAVRPPSGAGAARRYSGNDAGPGSIYNDFYMTWVIPTKDPERLRAALAMADPPVPVD